MRSASAYDWTPAAIDRLKDLWREGHSGSHVATLMGGGLTRCAVLGKVHRLGMSGERRPRVAPVRRYKLVRAPKRAYTRPTPKPAVAPRVFGLTLLDLQPWNCRWPGPEDRPPHSYCGEPKAFESSYCAAHYTLAHRVGPNK